MNNQRLLFAFILVTSLFFFWGLSYGLLDVLNKQFQESLGVRKSQSTLLQAAYFGAYFIMAIPAGWIMKRRGYKTGIITGLLLYAIGASLFYPAALLKSFPFFLLALFVIAAGITCLETAANPYATVLGDVSRATQRLNLAQSFNGVGSFLGPLVGGYLFFGGGASEKNTSLEQVQWTYLVIGLLVLLIAWLFLRTRLPEISESTTAGKAGIMEGSPAILPEARSPWQFPHFSWAVIAQFFYVGAQVGIAALFINYVTENRQGTSSEEASYLLSVALILFTIGRFAGTALMQKISPVLLLGVFALANILLYTWVALAPSSYSVWALIAGFFFMSIMFPTIFALGVKGLGDHTKRGSSYIIMSIVGAALIPPVMGSIANRSTALSYLVPVACFVVVLLFSWRVSGSQHKPVP